MNQSQDQIKKREYTEDELKVLEEFEKEYCYDKEFDMITCEFDAINMYWSLDKKVINLVKPLRRAVDFVEKHSKLSKEEIIQRINNAITYIEIVDDYKENPNGVGYVDTLFLGLSLKKDILEDEENLYQFLRHELTHMMGERIAKKPLSRKLLNICGYSEENSFELDSAETKRNESFNEAAVELFIAQENEFRELDTIGPKVYTNQDDDFGLYSINGNLIRQMLLARKIDIQELFDGLFDYNVAKSVMRKINGFRPFGPFKKISQTMDEISESIVDIFDKVQEIDLTEDEKQVKNLYKEQGELKEGLYEKISDTEKMIIDKMLCPRLKKLSEEERQELLAAYYPFIMCEKEYFISKTNFRALKPIENKVVSPWLKHIDVPALDIDNTKQSDKNTNNKDDRKGQEL